MESCILVPSVQVKWKIQVICSRSDGKTMILRQVSLSFTVSTVGYHISGTHFSDVRYEDMLPWANGLAWLSSTTSRSTGASNLSQQKWESQVPARARQGILTGRMTISRVSWIMSSSKSSAWDDPASARPRLGGNCRSTGSSPFQPYEEVGQLLWCFQRWILGLLREITFKKFLVKHFIVKKL